MNPKVTYLLRACLILGCSIFSALVSSYASAADHSANTHFVFQDDFEPVISHDQFERGALRSTSISTKLYKLKADKGIYPAGSDWIIKENELHWLVQEYIASKIYQLILGDALISDIVWVTDKKNKNTNYIAVRYDPSLLHFVKEEGQGNERRFIMDKFPFSCVLNNCQAANLSADQLENYAMVKTKNPYSTLNGMRIKNGELAILASIFMNDNDIAWGQNFALKPQDNFWSLTRIDFDGSLSFFDSFKICPGSTPAALMRAYGITAEQAELIAPVINDMNNVYYSISSATFKEVFPKVDSLQDINLFIRQSKAMQKAMTTIIDLDMNKLETVVDQAIQDIQPYINHELLNEYYHFGILKDYIYRSSKWNSIKSFILEKLGERQSQMEALYHRAMFVHEEL